MCLKTEATAQFGVGVDFSPYPDSFTSKKEEKKEPPPKDILIQKISAKFNQDEEKLHKLWLRGYGYIELTKLFIISDKSGKPSDEIIKLRDKKVKISEIAEKYGLNYKEIYIEAHKIKNELDSETTDYIDSEKGEIKQ